MSLTTLVAGTVATVGAAVATAVYANFSARVMPRLAALPAQEGIAAMQQFNRTAVQPPFMLAFFGAAAACVVLTIDSLSHAEKPLSAWLALTGSAAYLASFVMTIAFHVPRNDALARLNPDAGSSAAPWATFLHEWTSGNTVRAVLAGAGTVALAGATVLSLLKR